jgi:hypothetical protein
VLGPSEIWHAEPQRKKKKRIARKDAKRAEQDVCVGGLLSKGIKQARDARQAHFDRKSTPAQHKLSSLCVFACDPLFSSSSAALRLCVPNF